MQLLTETATNDQQALCRIAAIDTLGRFEDPRAVQALVDSYYRAGTFPPETAVLIRCQALRAMGETHNPAAIDHLALVVREPAVEGSEEEKQQALDIRLAAARTLGNFNQAKAAEALAGVMQSERDVALRDRVRDSLQACTGQRIPDDFQNWNGLVQEQQQGEALAGAERRSRVSTVGFTVGTSPNGPYPAP